MFQQFSFYLIWAPRRPWLQLPRPPSAVHARGRSQHGQPSRTSTWLQMYLASRTRPCFSPGISKIEHGHASHKATLLFTRNFNIHNFHTLFFGAVALGLQLREHIKSAHWGLLGLTGSHQHPEICRNFCKIENLCCSHNNRQETTGKRVAIPGAFRNASRVRVASGSPTS